MAFAAINMLTDLFLGYPFYETFRTLGMMVMPDAVEGSLSAAQLVPLGLLLHFVFSAVYGIVFAYVVTLAGSRAVPGPLLFLFGVFYGLFLWLVNFLIIAPILFPELMGPGGLSPAGFTLAHAFYGLGLGIYMSAWSPLADREAR